MDNGVIRRFESGATRDTAEGKLDFEGFLSPLVLQAFAEYMHRNRKMADGSLRSSDNWQKGIPVATYVKSLWRHFFAAWAWHRDERTNYSDADAQIENLCGVLFNAQGALHEILKMRDA